MLYLYISAPLYEASCSKGSEKSVSASATVAKSAIHGCLQLSRHPCRLWLYDEQSHKNNYASPKIRDMHEYNTLYAIKFVEYVLTPDSIWKNNYKRDCFMLDVWFCIF